jgi:5-oxoprolinase (ATP-hydrolysing) subunit C
VVFGAPFALRSDRQPLEAGKTFTLHAGEQLVIGATAKGMRAYFCVRGGFQGARVLGSRSGLAPLTAGAELTCSPGQSHPRFVSSSFQWNKEPDLLRILPGMQADWFDLDAFLSQEYEVTPVSNRMGLRLRGRPLPFPKRELLSEPVSPGAVQVTRDGQCIVLGVDGQTIGGYPKIAQVVSADVDKLAQLRPAARVRFLPVSLEEAEDLWQQKNHELDDWVTRLLETSVSE